MQIFVRDEEVKALQQKALNLEESRKKQAEVLAAELSRLKVEMERVRETARKERDQALAAQT